MAKKLLGVSSRIETPPAFEAAVRRFTWGVFQAIFRLEFLILDLLTIPGSLTNAALQVIARVTGSERIKRTGLMINALWHVEFICRMCPATRRNTRDPHREGFCMWNYHWRRGNYEIPPDFGLVNYLRQYTDGETNLEDYRFLYPDSETRGGGDLVQIRSEAKTPK